MKSQWRDIFSCPTVWRESSFSIHCQCDIDHSRHCDSWTK
jgi:hypothetical protein